MTEPQLVSIKRSEVEAIIRELELAAGMLRKLLVGEFRVGDYILTGRPDPPKD